MKWFFDTSVLIPVFLEDHEHHESSLAAFLRADKTQACCAAHSLAEVYATLTRLPGKHRLSGEQVRLLLQVIDERLAILTLSGREYFALIEQSASLGTMGGMIYDALLAQCALKADAQTILTWNLRDFTRLGTEVAKRTRTPASF